MYGWDYLNVEHSDVSHSVLASNTDRVTARLSGDVA